MADPEELDLGWMRDGTATAASLSLRLDAAGDALEGTAWLDHRHAGAPGVAHGGVLMLLLDEICGTVCTWRRQPAVTATLSVDFRAPIALPREVRVRARCERADGRKLHMHGEVFDGDVLVAEGRGLWLQVGTEHFERLGVEAPSTWSAGERRAG